MTTEQAARATDSELLGERVDTPDGRAVLRLLDRICPWRPWGEGLAAVPDYDAPTACDVHIYGRAEPLRLRLDPYPGAAAQLPTTALRLTGLAEGYVSIHDIDAITVVEW